jgi:RNA polymerase sigma factor for flagellar operon FliA
MSEAAVVPAEPLGADELGRWRRFVASRDVELRNRFVEQYLPLARGVAGTVYARRGGLQVDFGDYLQFATIGLIEAVDRYDPELAIPFSAFANFRIRGAILNGLEGLSEHYQQLDLHKRLRQERLESLATNEPETRRRDSFALLADMAVGLALSHLLEGSGWAPGDEQAVPAYRQEFYATAQERQLRESLALLVQALPEQHRRVIRYHYYQRLAFAEIAGLLGVSRGRISQVHGQALALLRQGHAGAGSVDLGT